jgi:hypothetical protein
VGIHTWGSYLGWCEKGRYFCDVMKVLKEDIPSFMCMPDEILLFIKVKSIFTMGNFVHIQSRIVIKYQW